MQLIEFKPILKRIRWGGRRLGTTMGKPIGNADDYAESWDIADHGQDQSVVLNGFYQGETLNELIHNQNVEMLGIHAGREQFPLLVKFLDAHDRLSVQVHPNDEQAREFNPHENGKTEAWIILEADPKSVIYAGLKSEVTRKTLESNLETGTVENCLHCFQVSPGDCVFIPAGTVHAIGEGILLAEIQQSSDLTFRLFDWGRLGTDGNPREVHIEESLQCIDFDRGPVDLVVPHIVSTSGSDVEELVRCDDFVLRRHRTGKPFSIVHDNRFHILMMLRGNAALICENQRKNVSMGSTVLMPADASDVRVVPEGEIILLETFLPD
jgi:mannose-6-phosphate isomerase